MIVPSEKKEKKNARPFLGLAQQLLENKKNVKSFDDKECANCGEKKTLLSKCSRCKLTNYCCQACQHQHWSAVGGHKLFCVSANQRSPDKMISFQEENGFNCAICQENLFASSQFALPCSHAYHLQCITKLRETSGNIQSCPVCRSQVSNDVDIEVIFKYAVFHFTNI